MDSQVTKSVNVKYSLEGLMLNLKFQYRPPDVKSWLIGEDPDAGKVEDRSSRGLQRMVR